MQNDTSARGGIADFDFLRGRWHVDNRRLRLRLQGNDDWETFTATQHNCALPGGIGNYDDFIAATWRPDYVGMSLRLFNPQSGLWSIYWLDNQTGGVDRAGLMLPPVVGKVADGVGLFEGDEVLDGKPIRVRYTWSSITSDSACWEQAMSDDGGRSWELNWRMLFQRVA
jgi:hypothetical protein